MIILFYPDKPIAPSGNLSRVLRVLNTQEEITWHNDPNEPYDIHFFFSYTRNKIEPDELTLNAKKVINGGCWDITKERVHKVFNDISVDPKTYKGICVEKEDLQGLHKNHKLIQCPTEPKEGFVYEKFFENKEGELYVKYRVYYSLGIKHIIKKYTTKIFITDIQKWELVSKREVFTEEQGLDLIEKCEAFGFHFGELDVVMDGKTPIVLDVNNVVGGGIVPSLTGTPIFKRIDNLLFDFLKKWYDQSV